MPTIHHGDCIETMNAMPPESVDAIVTDPPYGLSFMSAKWDATPPGIQWAEACHRALKPGGHIAAFGGTRTWHRLAVAIEDAGFEMRDSLAWLYGSGFPKSHDVGKAIDKLAGHVRGSAPDFRNGPNTNPATKGTGHYGGGYGIQDGTDAGPATPEAAQWDGWGTALKPAFEPIVLARKPLAEKTVARNVLEHGTGAINVDACRIETDDNLNGGGASGGPGGAFLLDGAESVDELRALAEAGEKTPNGRDAQATLARALTSKERMGEYVQPSGRWPANVLLDHHAAAWVDEQSGITKDGVTVNRNLDPEAEKPQTVYGGGWKNGDRPDHGYGGSGGASRFFYNAKAPKRERPNVDGVQHPTVKPLAVMRWLIRLTTPPGGVVLDPFAGSGTTIEAALIEGFNPIGIEMEAEYLPLIQHRIDRQAGTLPA